ncbi:glutathione S-transferase family protein [Bordetella bronchialis]|uniref:glutathione S-transferase family protein n=1 Tax=Bordetella bronchialis TaxID=463025 RepID=UPI003D01462B
MTQYELIGSRGCGSAIVEAALRLSGLDVRLTDIPYLKPGPGRDRLLRLNPLGQVPTLILPGGAVMTESAAMILHLDDAAPHANLAPASGSMQRARFFEMLLRMAAAVYPTFTFGDDPARWTGEGEAARKLRAATDKRREMLWRSIEEQVSEPHVLGDQLTALDLYITVMTHWRPRRAWFDEHCPRLAAVADQAAGHPRVRDVLHRHFSGAGD